MTLKAADLFCGAGGTTAGAESSGAARCVFALNHWGVAVETHKANFPHARHVNSRLENTSPSEAPKIDLLFASPECTHHSRARGGRPTSDQQRSGGWDLLRWVDYHRPSWLVVENVTEWESWGPVADNGLPLKSKAGHTFQAWVKAIESYGYRVDWQRLNAADFGAATSRTRLFVVARKGRRMPVFPDPSHTEQSGGELPGLGLPRWRAAAEIIDWSIPCPSVFLRSRPLADKTLSRIEAGLRKFVGPFTAAWDNHGANGGYVRSAGNPLSTLVTKANLGLAVPCRIILRGNMDAADLAGPVGTITCGGRHDGVAVPFALSTGSGGAPRGCGEPLPTIVTVDGTTLAVPFVSAFHNGPDANNRNYPLNEAIGTLDTSNRYAVAVPFLANVNHGGDPRFGQIGDTLGTVTAKNGRAVVVPFTTTFYANGKPYSINDPLCTLSTRERVGLAYAIVECAPSIEPRSEGERRLLATMRELGVADVGFRMLQNHELSAAQGFPSEYIFAGKKADVTRQIGNSVSPPVARAITEALAG